MRIIVGVVFASALVLPMAFALAEEKDNFAGAWQEIRDSAGKPKPKTPKQLVIKLDGGTLMVTMKGPGKLPSADVTFQLGGPEVTYTGLDGDEFHIKATRDLDSLVFAGTEKELGRSLPVHEVWTLRTNNEGEVLVDTKDAKDHNHPARISKYERIKQ